MKLRRSLLAAVCFMLVAVIAWGLHAALSSADENKSLATWVPPGALLSIEAKDFSALLHDWTTSPEAQAWMSSDDYQGFSRSRLFGRLGDAQNEFATTAGLSPDAKFLQSVAGKESIFAWYDIGNLEFLYITRMEGNTAANTPLMSLKSRFQQRSVGAENFYVRHEGEPMRTVAFAVHGPYLVLGTREDLVAGALIQMQHPANDSLATEGWYTSATSHAGGKPGDLRMALDLARIVPSPYFRSYWVQENITEMKQYSAAVTDLYREPTRFREERTLLRADGASPASTDLGAVMQYVPHEAGVYRAVAHPSANDVVNAFETKLLSGGRSEAGRSKASPAAAAAPEQVGNPADLETRIDVPRPASSEAAESLSELRMLVQNAQPEAMLTVSSTTDGSEPVFIHTRSALVLLTNKDWDATQVRRTLSDTLGSRFSAIGQALSWKDHNENSQRWTELAGLHPLAIAIDGKALILATDGSALQQVLSSVHTQKTSSTQATLMSGFNHTAERARFLRLTTVLDHRAPAAQGGDDVPPFFSRNIASLSNAFKAMSAETFVERPDAQQGATRQTVVYEWQR